MLSSRIAGMIVAVLVALSAAGTAHAVNLVYNGDFEIVGQQRSRQISVSPTEQYLPGWTNGTFTDYDDPQNPREYAGYNFYVLPGTATLINDNDNSVQTNDFGLLSIWGGDNGGAAGNSFTGFGPDGAGSGNFVMADGDFRVAPISQQINGLIAGGIYRLSFAWAGGQQYGSEADTTSSWNVGFGSQTQSTPVLSVGSHNFSGWQTSTMWFTANSSSEVLSFLAHGTPVGQPPFVFLDNVELTAVPETASWMMMVIGFGGLGMIIRRRRRTVAHA